MLLKEILKNIDFNHQNEINSIPDIEISGIAFDNRKVEKNFLFCALIGEISDGHKFIPNAINSGAVAIICQDDSLKSQFPSIIFIKVNNSRLAAAIASQNYYGNTSKNINFIGITGTNGKTTTSFLIANIFHLIGNDRKLGEKNNNAVHKQRKVGVIGTTGIFYGKKNYPSAHTTPESLELAKIINAMSNDGIDTIAMEVSSHSLVQQRVAGINFSAALFTNLTHEHLDYHKTMHEYAKAKKILFDHLDKNSIAIAMDYQEYSQYILKDSPSQRKILIGYSENNDIFISDYKLNVDYTEFTLKFNYLDGKPSHTFKTKLIGKFNIENSSLAIAYFISIGYDIDLINRVLPYANGAPGRMDRKILKNGSIAIVDYAHTPDALEKALLTCKEILKNKPMNKLIAVFGCGGDRDTTKRPLMGKIATEIADTTIITDDNPRTEDSAIIRKQIIAGIDINKNNYIEIYPRENALKTASEIAKQDDIILIAGKGHETYQIIGTEKFHFDDKEIISKL